MNEELTREESTILLQSVESITTEDNFCETDLPYECDISYSLRGVNDTLVSHIPFKSEYCSDEELESKALLEVFKCLRRRGIIGFINILIKEENRRIDIV